MSGLDDAIMARFDEAVYLRHQLAEANATIAQQRKALEALIDEVKAADVMDAGVMYAVSDGEAALAQPLPPAAAKLLAERDAGRALYEAVRESGGSYGPEVWQAVEAYRKAVT